MEGASFFIPSTWASWRVDANGDGHADSPNIFDASAAAARYLCSSGGRLATVPAQGPSITSYNASAICDQRGERRAGVPRGPIGRHGDADPDAGSVPEPKPDSESGVADHGISLGLADTRERRCASGVPRGAPPPSRQAPEADDGHRGGRTPAITTRADTRPDALGDVDPVTVWDRGRDAGRDYPAVSWVLSKGEDRPKGVLQCT